MEWGVFEVLTSFAAILLAIYYYFSSTFNFWKDRGVVGPKPTIGFGNFRRLMFGSISLGDYLTEEYQKYKNEPMFGIYARRKPNLVVTDPDCIKDILIKDFSSFSDRGLTVHEKADPLSQHLFMLEPKRWRPLRTKLSPVFTSGKLKEMFYLLRECADNFENFLLKSIKKDSVIECRELTAKFTTDVIGVCVFGLKMNALDDEDSQFRKIGRKVFEVDTVKLIKIRLRDSIPWLYDLLGPFMYDHEVNDFFIDTMIQTMNYRKETNIKRNDFVDLLMALRDDPSKINDKDIELTDVFLTAQAFVFFVAGFETSSTTMSNALYELALRPSIQDKLRIEIEEELAKHDNSVTYESIKSMKYMHKVFQETLRKYPPVTVIMRKSVKPYTFEKNNVNIPTGINIFIPAYAIQRDPLIYSDPETFDPERFDEEVAQKRHPAFYLPFGDGPRNCIGARFANYQTKVGLIKILQNFRVEPCDETTIPYVNDPKAFLLSPINGIKLKFVKIDK